MGRSATAVGLVLLASFVLAVPVVAADEQVDVESALRAKYPVSALTPDHTNLMPNGSPLVLRADALGANGLLARHSATPPTNTFKDGKLHYSKLKLANVAEENGYRTFVSGERLWVTKIMVFLHEVDIEVCSDDLHGFRYRAKITFPIHSDADMTTAGILQRVDQVFAPASIAK